MSAIENMAGMLALAFLRYVPAIVLPALSPLRWAPPLVRIVLALGLAWITVLAMPAEDIGAGPGHAGMGHAGMGHAVAWTAAVFGELAIGTVFGLTLAMPQAALHHSGWLLDVQAGLGTATLFDPGAQNETQSLLGMALMLLATTLFFTLDLHLDLYRSLIASTQVLPLGQMASRPEPAAILAMIGNSALLGLMVVAPVMLGLFAIDIGVAYATRAMPQANVYFLALPLKALAAMLLLSVALKTMPALIARLYHDAFARIPSMLGA